MRINLHLLWTIVKTIVGGLGGFAGLTKIFEWIFSGPKIIGEVESIITAHSTITPTGEDGVTVFAQMYAVNKRISPTTPSAVW
jgi:hypothetical protein